MVADLLSPKCYHWQIAKVKNYNLNVTEILDSDFKNAFPGIFNFTAGNLISVFLRSDLAMVSGPRTNPRPQDLDFSKDLLDFMTHKFWAFVIMVDRKYRKLSNVC